MFLTNFFNVLSFIVFIFWPFSFQVVILLLKKFYSIYLICIISLSPKGMQACVCVCVCVRVHECHSSYPRPTKVGAWGRAFGCVCVCVWAVCGRCVCGRCVCVCVFVCLQCREKTTGGIDLKLDLLLVHDDPKPPINFGGQRSKVKVTGSKKVKILLLPL